MNFKPTEDQRSVLLALQFVKCGATQPASRSSETPRIASISALFADHEGTTLDIYEHRDEATLLRRFWLSLRANDRIFSADVTEGLSLLRQRSWLLNVIPAPQIDLCCVYGVELWDTRLMWTDGYTPRPLYIDMAQPDSPDDFETSINEASDFEIVVHSRD
jgi:transposase InsO family protein